MNKKKQIIGAALIMMLLLALTGCSPSQQEILNASLKMQDVKSMKQHTTLTFQMKGSGFEPDIQTQVDTASTFLNDLKLDINAQTSGNEQKTAVKSQVDLNVALQGMTLNMPIWVDSDFTGSTPKMTEIIKIPLIAKTSLPSQFASREYMVMNPMDMNNSELGNINMTKLMEFSRSFQASEVNFLTSYAKRFNPNFDTSGDTYEYLQTDDGLKIAHIYDISLNDAQFKNLIRYTVNNFVQDKEAMNFVKDSMHSILEVSQIPDKEKSLSDFDQAFKEFDVNKQTFLSEFNALMDQLNNVTILGEKGLNLEFALYNGYLIKESGSINLNVDMAQINQLINTLGNTIGASDSAAGIVDLMINFNTENSEINRPLEIKIPEINQTNSFNYLDLMKFVTSGAETQK